MVTVKFTQDVETSVDGINTRHFKDGEYYTASDASLAQSWIKQKVAIDAKDADKPTEKKGKKS